MLSREKLRFVTGLTLLCVFYLAFELFFNTFTMISVDEFWFAHSIYQYRHELPYRQFAPYKTVIGYYLLLIPMLLTHGILQTLVFIKNSLAVLNAVIFFTSAWWLQKFFSRHAILIGLALIIFAEMTLSYSTNIRVDLLAYWCCFFSLLLLLNNKYFSAGLLLGLGFTISQKAIWYIAASDITLLLFFMLATNRREFFWQCCRFNFACLFVIGSYLAFWSVLTDAHTVFNNVFLEAAVMYKLNWYNEAREFFWQLTLTLNPLLFLLWPLTLISLLIQVQDIKKASFQLFITIYAAVIMCCLIPYKQVFPYYMQVTIPVFFILYIAFFDWLLALAKQESVKIIVPRIIIWSLLSLYMAGIMLLIHFLKLPIAYLLILAIPLLIGACLSPLKSEPAFSNTFYQLLTITILFVGGVYPVTLYVGKLWSVNGDYQRANINEMNTLLLDGSDYVAGIELIYNKSQPIPGMRHLMGPALSYLYQPTPLLRSAMLASLNEDPTATIDTIIQHLSHTNVKFYVNNYRMNLLPPKIKNYLATQYEHYWGSIYLYAPKVMAGKNSLLLKFSGWYLLQSDQTGFIQLNNKNYSINKKIYLNKGYYYISSLAPFRLKLIPDETSALNPLFQNDHWQRMIY